MRFKFLVLTFLAMPYPVEAAPKQRATADRYQEAIDLILAGKRYEAYRPAKLAAELNPDNKDCAKLAAYLKPYGKRGKLREYALEATKDDEATVEKLAAYLKKGGEDDTERAWLIYCWVTDRISYDVEAWNPSQMSPEQRRAKFKRDAEARRLMPRMVVGNDGTTVPVMTTKSIAADVLKNRRGMCGGYTILYLALAEEMGVPANGGHGSCYVFDVKLGADKMGNHAWVTIKLDGESFVIDPTWGSGCVQPTEDNDGYRFVKGFNDFYFCVPAAAARWSHCAEKRDYCLARLHNFKAVELQQYVQLGFSGEQLNRALLSVDNRDNALVRAYSLPLPCKVEAPLSYTVSAADEYNLAVEALAVDSVALVNNRVLHRFDRDKDTGKFRFRMCGFKGVIQIEVKVRGRDGYRTVLQYEGQ